MPQPARRVLEHVHAVPGAEAPAEQDGDRAVRHAEGLAHRGVAALGREGLHVRSPGHDLRARAGERGDDLRDRRHQRGGLAHHRLAVALQRADDHRRVERRLQGARVVHHRRVDLEQARHAAGLCGRDPLAAEVVVALHDHVGAHGVRDRGHRAPRAEAEEAMRRPPGDRMPAHAGRVRQRARGAVAADDHVDLVAAAGQAAGDLEDVHAAAGGARDHLVRGHVEHLHARGRSRPKNGPVRMPPKRTTSSFRTQVSAWATASTSRPGGRASRVARCPPCACADPARPPRSHPSKRPARAGAARRGGAAGPPPPP